MPQSKSQKKFEKKHLPKVLKQRREKKKASQKYQQKEKKKSQRADDIAEAEDVAEGKQQREAKVLNGLAKGDKALNDMSVDDFFQGGFELSSKPIQRGKPTPKIGKRKRTEPEVEDEAEDADSDSEGQAVEDDDDEDIEEGLDEDDEDDEDHVKQLEALAKKDPEFHRFLKENDPELLGFGDNGMADADGMDEDGAHKSKKRKQQKEQNADPDEDEEEQAGADEAEDEPSGRSTEVSKALVTKWKTSMTEEHSLRAMREVVVAFRAAAHMNEDTGKDYKYTIIDSDAYHQLLVLALDGIPKVLQHHLPVKETASGKLRLPTDSKKFKTTIELVKSYALAVNHLLEGLSDAATLRLTLTSLLPLLPYVLSLKKLVKDLCNTVANVWSAAGNAESTRIAAFLVLRRLTVIGDPATKEGVLKTAYQGLVKGSRNTTIHTLQGVNLMKNSAAELWGIDATMGYTTGFQYLRQLSIHLRNSITNTTKDAYKTVYNWQYVHSLDFWSRVLSTHCSSLREAELGSTSPLRALIYPLVQITLGAMRLIPTATYFPLRFHLMRSLLRLSLATSTYVPLAPALYEVLSSNEMKKSGKNSTLKAVDFTASLRINKAYLHTRVYQDGLGEQIDELLQEFFVLWVKNIAFPEMALPVIVMLKRWYKQVSSSSGGNRNGKLNNGIKLLTQKLESQSRWIEERRTKVDFAPNNHSGVEAFLKDVEWEKIPLGAFVAGQRKVRDEKAKLMEEGRKQDEKRKAEEKRERNREDAEDFDGVEDGKEDEDMLDDDEVSD